MRIVDCTLPLYEGMPGHPLHPTAPKLLSGTLSHRLTSRWMGTNSDFGPVSFTNEQVVLSGHCGTHMDAPLHSDPEGAAAELIELQACVGAATKLDLRHLRGPRVLISATDLRAAMSDDHRCAPTLLLNTGWSDLLQDRPDEYYRDSMGLDASAVQLVRELHVRCIGIDAPSIDAPNSQGAPAHMEFSRGRPPVYIVENLAHLSELPFDVPFFATAPLPLTGASGSPVRAFAVLESEAA